MLPAVLAALAALIGLTRSHRGRARDEAEPSGASFGVLAAVVVALAEVMVEPRPVATFGEVVAGATLAIEADETFGC